eukprot:scaffold7941_cov390-Prasinococcus_capsulatus_cf.AAC.4
MPRLVALLSHTSREMKKAAAQAVWSVCYSVTRNQQLALEHGALRPLLRLLCMEHQQQQQPPQYNEVPIDTSAIPTPQSTSGVAAEASVEQSAEAMDAAPPSPLRAADSPRRLLRRQSTTEETRNTRSVVDADTSSTPNQPPQTQHEAVPQQQQEEALVYPDEPSFRELRHAGAGALWHLSSYEAGRRQMVEEGALDPLRVRSGPTIAISSTEGSYRGCDLAEPVWRGMVAANRIAQRVASLGTRPPHESLQASRLVTSPLSRRIMRTLKKAVRPVGILLDELGPAASFDTGLVWTEVDSILKLVQQPPAVPYAEVRELGCWIVASIALQNNSKFAGRTKLLMEGAEELLQNALHYDTSVKVRLRAAEALLALGITNAVQPSEGRGVNQEEKADTPTEQEGDGPSAADSSKMCIVCCSRARDCALYRCGHVVVCSFCARILITGAWPSDSIHR